MIVDVDNLCLDQWTPIGEERPERARNGKKWWDHENAPMTIKTAQELYDRKLLLKAQRQRASDGVWEVVIKAPARPPWARIVRKSPRHNYD